MNKQKHDHRLRTGSSKGHPVEGVPKYMSLFPFCIALGRKPPCELNIGCVLTPDESGARVWPVNTFKSPGGLGDYTMLLFIHCLLSLPLSVAALCWLLVL